MPSLFRNADTGCDMKKEISFGIDKSFIIIAIVICITIILISLILMKYMHRTDDMVNIRENVINYEAEGSGEADTDDLNVLRAISDAPIAPVGLQGRGTIIADINAIYIMDWYKN